MQSDTFPRQIFQDWFLENSLFRCNYANNFVIVVIAASPFSRYCRIDCVKRFLYWEFTKQKHISLVVLDRSNYVNRIELNFSFHRECVCNSRAVCFDFVFEFAFPRFDAQLFVCFRFSITLFIAAAAAAHISNNFLHIITIEWCHRFDFHCRFAFV